MTEDDLSYIDDWEEDCSLFENEDWAGLLNLRKERIIKNPEDLNAQQRYIEALNLNKKYIEALAVVIPIYKENYDEGFGIHEIMEALIGLGKTENDFNWIKKPRIFELDQITLKLCVDFLKTKRKFITVREIYGELFMEYDYLKFDENQFGEFLVSCTNEFTIQLNKDYVVYSKIMLKKL